MIKNILLIGLGGGIGSIARYLCQRWFMANHSYSFPWGTFAVNFIGCFLIGLFWGLSFKSFDSNDDRPLWRLHNIFCLYSRRNWIIKGTKNGIILYLYCRQCGNRLIGHLYWYEDYEINKIS